MYIRITQSSIEMPYLDADEGMLEPMAHTLQRGDAAALVCLAGRFEDFPYVLSVADSLLKTDKEFMSLERNVQGLWVAAFTDGRLLLGTSTGVLPLWPKDLPVAISPVDVPFEKLKDRPSKAFPLPPKVKLRLATTGGVN